MSGDDYASVNKTLTFEPGETEKTVTVSIVDDAVNEDAETFTLKLSNLTGHAVMGANEGTGTIHASDAVTVSVNDVSVDESAGTATFTVRLSGPASGVVTVKATTVNGTAMSGDDYASVNKTLTFEPGETQKTVALSFVDDAEIEGAETLTLKLSNLTGLAVRGANEGVGTINASDAVTVSVNDVSVDESAGTATFTVRLSGPASGVVTVKATTVNGTAMSGDDYASVNKTLTFEPGETQKTVTVSIVDDAESEVAETFTLKLSNLKGRAVMCANEGVGTIAGSDAVTVSVNDVTVDESARTATIKLRI
jgi:hypothetical protein